MPVEQLTTIKSDTTVNELVVHFTVSTRNVSLQIHCGAMNSQEPSEVLNVLQFTNNYGQRNHLL